MDIKPFEISIPDSELNLLRQKLLLTRLPTHLTGAQWTESSRNDVTVDLIHSISSFWLNHYSWRSEEALLNKLPQFITPINVDGFGDLDVHFIHSPSSKPNSIPLLYLHGWPGSINEVSKALPLLNDASFHVVAPSLPGWMFSSYPNKAGFKHRQHAEAMHRLMLKLGYNEYVLQGGDWGGEIAPLIAVMYPEHVKALHLNYFPVPEPKLGYEPKYTEFEEHSIEKYKHWQQQETGYFAIQSTKPLTLGIGLHDSPIGMLAWMADKLFVWSDSQPRNPRGYKWSHTELITWTLLHYFAIDGPTASLAMYAENADSAGHGEDREFVDVPTGVSAFAGEAEMVPRLWAEKKANVVWWREHEVGGHFAMYERPEEMVEDIIGFVDKLFPRTSASIRRAEATSHVGSLGLGYI